MALSDNMIYATDPQTVLVYCKAAPENSKGNVMKGGKDGKTAKKGKKGNIKGKNKQLDGGKNTDCSANDWVPCQTNPLRLAPPVNQYAGQVPTPPSPSEPLPMAKAPAPTPLAINPTVPGPSTTDVHALGSGSSANGNGWVPFNNAMQVANPEGENVAWPRPSNSFRAVRKKVMTEAVNGATKDSDSQVAS